MKKSLNLFLVLAGWFAIIAQYVLMMEKTTDTLLVTNIRFFSFFTILTNTIVATYFSWLLFNENKARISTLTAITVYITVVGLTYQVMLRHIWDPQGLQKVVDELLHTIIPIGVIIYWFIYQNKSNLKYSNMFAWFIFPIAYVIYIFIRGHYSGEYPYPFIDVTKIGFTRALINSGFVTLMFIVLSSIFTFISRRQTA
jgi:hypothetical protein